MKEIRDIIRSYDALTAQGKAAALATVVHVEGSSYRRPGARMLIAEDGALTGAISGGCLEGDAMRKALRVIQARRPALVTYDTTDDDDATLGIGLGCQGIIQVLIEPVLPEEPVHPLALLKTANARRQPGVLATCFSWKDRTGAQPGTRFWLGQDGDTCGECPLPGLALQWRDAAQQVLASGESRWVQYDAPEGTFTVFFEFVPPAIALVIAGAGNDVRPLVDMAGILGWDITVVDGRANYARPERFAGGCQVLLARPEQVLEHIAPDDYTVFALMTHNYNYDKALLHALCQRKARYIAMLGPKPKLARMLGEFEAEGRALSPGQVNAIFSPAGLDIGAETAEEIALAMLAEIKAFLSRREGYSLRRRQAPVHNK